MSSVFHAATATWSTTAGNKTATATPGVGYLVVVVAACTGTGIDTTAVTDSNVDGLGLYTKIGSSFAAPLIPGSLSMWVRNALVGSGTSTVFTAAQASSTGGGLDVFFIDSMQRTGLSAVRQSGGGGSNPAGATPSVVMGSAVLTGNPVIGAVLNGTSPATLTPRAGYTETTDLGYGVPTTGLETMYIASGETAGTIAWGGTSASGFAFAVVEFDTSAAPGTRPKRWRQVQARPRSTHARTRYAA